MSNQADGSADPLLAEKCRQLHSLAQIQQKRIKELEDTVRSLDGKRSTYEEVTVQLRKLWDGVCDDILHVAKQATRDLNDGQAISKPSMNVNGLQCVDPFLAYLVGADGRTADDAFRRDANLRKEYNDIEKHMQSRADETSTVFHQMLVYVRRLQEKAHGVKQEEFGRLERTSTNGSHEGQALRTELDQSRARVRTLTAETRQLGGHLFAAQQRCTELGNKLAEKDVENEALQRKLLQDKSDSGAGPAVPAGGPSTAPAAAAPAAAAAAAGKPNHNSTSSSLHSTAQAVEVEQLKRRRDELAAALDQERAARITAEQQVRELQERFQRDSDWVLETEMYQSARLEIEQLQQRQQEMRATEAIQANDLAAMERKHQQRVMELDNLRAVVRAHERAIEGLNRRLAQGQEEVAERDRLIVEQAELKVAAGKAAELQKLLDMMREECRLLRERTAERKVNDGSDPMHAHGGAAAVEQLAAAQQAQARLERQVAESAAESAALRQELSDAEARQEELHTMLSVLTAATAAPTELEQAQAELQQARTQVTRLQEQLADSHTLPSDSSAPSRSSRGGPAALDAPRTAAVQARLWHARAQDARAALEGLEGRVAALEGENVRLKDEVSNAKVEAEVFKTEVDAIGDVLKDLQGQNTDLLTAQQEKETQLASSKAENLKLRRTEQSRLDEVERLQGEVSARDALSAALDSRSQMVNELEGRCTALEAAKQGERAEVGRRVHEVSQLQERLDLQQTAMTRLQRDVDSHRARVNELEKEIAVQTARKAAAEKAVQDLEERLKRVCESTHDSEQVQELQQENQAFRRHLMCPVCNENMKSAIISKCWHMFCNRCVQQRLDNRTRKCPQCGIGFGHADVHEAFL